MVKTISDIIDCLRDLSPGLIPFHSGTDNYGDVTWASWLMKWPDIDYLFNSSFGLSPTKTQKLHITNILRSLMTRGFSSQWVCNVMTPSSIIQPIILCCKSKESINADEVALVTKKCPIGNSVHSSYTHRYIYIYRERERERERWMTDWQLQSGMEMVRDATFLQISSAIFDDVITYMPYGILDNLRKLEVNDLSSTKNR